MKAFKASFEASKESDTSKGILTPTVGLTMPLLTITLVRTISFTIYETTKRVGQAESQRKTRSKALSIRNRDWRILLRKLSTQTACKAKRPLASLAGQRADFCFQSGHAHSS